MKKPRLTEAAVIAEAREAGFCVTLSAWNRMTKTQRRAVLILIKQLTVTGGQMPQRVR